MNGASRHHSPGPRTKASHPVRACQICAISKAKCIPRLTAQDGKCERCHRLRKECLPAVIVQRKPRRPRTNRTAQLEEKLEGLVSLLTAVQQTGNSSLDSSSIQLQVQKPADPLTPNSTSGTQNWSNVPPPPQDSMLPQPQYLRSPLNRHISTPSSLSSTEQLNTFQTKMAPHFPFVIVPPGTDTAELLETKPFLYQTIMMVTSYKQVSQQLEQRAEIMRLVAEQLLVYGKKSVDLIQGLLVFIAYYHHYLGVSPQMTNSIQLATALVFDMGLHKPLRTVDGYDMFTDAMKTFNERVYKTKRTLEERRVFLGLWCMTHTLATNIGKIEPLNNTLYVQECCQILEEQQEYPSDVFVVAQIRLHCLTDKARSSFPSVGVDYFSTLGFTPIVMLVNTFEKDLERLKTSLPAELQENILFQIYSSSVSIHINDIAIRKRSTSGNILPTSNQPPLSLLHACLEATTTFFKQYMSIPSHLYSYLPMPLFAMAAHAAVVLAMLNLFHFDNWDLALVRQVAPFSSIVGDIALKYEEASRMTNSDASKGWNAFERCAQKLRRLVDWYDARLAGRQLERRVGHDTGMGALADAATRGLSNGTGTAMMCEVQADLELIDETFWVDFTAWNAYDDLI